MGFRLTWLSIEGKDRTTLFRDPSVRPSGTFVDDVVEGIAGRAHADGAYLVVAVDDQGRHMEPSLPRRISRAASVLVCSVHEACMFSHAARWADGEEVWHVTHGGEGGRHLDVAGDPPAELAAIHSAQETAQQAETERRQTKLKRAPSSGVPSDIAALFKDIGLVQAPLPMAMGVNHIFDVPIALCDSLVGLRHDHATFWHAAPFEILVPRA